MIDWDFWGTGIFEFVKRGDGEDRAGEVSALLWKWDEWEEATKFERLV